MPSGSPPECSGAARMITRETLAGVSPLELLASLGYSPQPVAIVASEWRRAGIAIDWEDATSLAVRLAQLDVYGVDGTVSDEQPRGYLRSLAAYNVVVKPVLF